jgi:diguanylate cyclase (GGDEF)-like protein
LRPFDRAYRVGGEEFAVILAAADSGSVGLTAERLRQSIERHPTMIGTTPVTVTASVGAAIIGPGMDGAGVVAAADDALYRAKKGGRNRTELHSDPG